MTDKDAPLDFQGAVCPLPLRHQQVMLGHGSGGKMTHDLIADMFTSLFDNPILNQGNDAALLAEQFQGQIVTSTDAHVVWPLFFPGGDIGKLAVCGTVNDVSMLGAKPLYITASFILEEGLAFETLYQVVHAMQQAAQAAGVQIVAGDTKVVQKGKADGMYISTTGIGVKLPGAGDIGGQYARVGDKVILSGTMGDHGIAVLAARGELGLETEIASDVAPLSDLVETIIAASQHIHVLRDPTRGGVAATLNEIAKQSKLGIVLNETALPVRPAVASACEILGFDPLYIANEGKVLVFAAPEDADTVLAAMRQHPAGQEAVIIGAVQAEPPGRVLMKTLIGSHRIVDVPLGEILPRIC